MMKERMKEEREKEQELLDHLFSLQTALIVCLIGVLLQCEVYALMV